MTKLASAATAAVVAAGSSSSSQYYPSQEGKENRERDSKILTRDFSSSTTPENRRQHHQRNKIDRTRRPKSSTTRRLSIVRNLQTEEEEDDDDDEELTTTTRSPPMPMSTLISRLMASGSMVGEEGSDSGSSCGSPVQETKWGRRVLGQTQPDAAAPLHRERIEMRTAMAVNKTKKKTEKQGGLFDDEVSESENSSSGEFEKDEEESGLREHETAVRERMMAERSASYEDSSEDEKLPGRDDSEEDLTDLSGFIVDDDAELTIYESSSEAEESDLRLRVRRGNKKVVNPGPRSTTRRRLVRGRDLKKKEEDKEKRDLEEVVKKIETIDLTSSPAPAVPQTQRSRGDQMDSLDDKDYDNQATTVNAVLHFSPPPPPVTAHNGSSEESPFSPQKRQNSRNFPTDLGTTDFTAQRLTTPPASPTKAPPRLNSPSKSPNRKSRPRIPQSPHRQSVDAFWSSDIINEWNDQYSPTKETPLTSPRKKGIARFLVWSDDDDDDEESESTRGRPETEDSSGTRPASPSPIRPRNKRTMDSPSKDSSPQKSQLAQQRKREKLQRQQFESTKQELAESFLRALDSRVADSRLSHLTSSTGGVKIVWSKTLRSTAGRANWRCTRSIVVSPAKSSSQTSQDNVAAVAAPAETVKHYAHIELATKVVTTRSRLLNTLAHEFCHLTNIMISNVKNQPHGASFKRWAEKVTRAFEDDQEFYVEEDHDGDDDDDDVRNRGTKTKRSGIKVSIKHDYIIDFKYLWICGGEAARPENAMSSRADPSRFDQRADWETWVLEKLESEGCGAHYGRHSKSIKPDMHRCGKCKGGLVQVRPRPRFEQKAAAHKRRRAGLGIIINGGDGKAAAVGAADNGKKYEEKVDGEKTEGLNVSIREIDYVDLLSD